MYLRTFAAVLLIALTGAASAEIYSWKDSNGRVHYSDQPPSNVEAKSMKKSAAAMQQPEADQSSVPTTVTSAPAAKGWEDKDREFKERRAKQAEAEAKQKKEQADKDAKAQYCSDLRRSLAMLEQGGRIGRPNDKGEVEIMNDNQIKKDTEQMRERISKECK